MMEPWRTRHNIMLPQAVYTTPCMVQRMRVKSAKQKVAAGVLCCAVLLPLTLAVRSKLSCLPCDVSAWHDTDISMPKSYGWGRPADKTQRHAHQLTFVCYSS